MRKKTRAAVWAMVILAALGVTMLPGCGGGGGGGGDGGGGTPGFLGLSPTVFFGERLGTTDTLTRFPAVPTPMPDPTLPQPAQPASAYIVGPAQFGTGAANTQHFILLTFNNLIDASTIKSNPPSGLDGIVIFRNQETAPGSGIFVSIPQEYALDSQGIIDLANQFPTPNSAPPTLRLYVQSGGQIVAGAYTPQVFLPGQYTVAINQSLRSADGGPFCSAGGGSNCQNTYLPVLYFTIGGDSTDLTLNQSAASVPTQNDPAVPINSEIVLNFQKPVDFQSLVGQTSTLDPFISRPRPVGYVADCNPPPMGVTYPPIPPFQNIGNLYVNYNRPTDVGSGQPEPPPTNLGYVAYMPDPFLNPNQVRLRFVDITSLVGTNNPNVPGAVAPFTTQNYASNPEKLPIRNPPTTGPILQLPPVLPVAGSLPGYNPVQGANDPRAAVLDVVVISNNFVYNVPPFPQIPPVPAGNVQCYGPPTSTGLVDRSGNNLNYNAAASVPDFWLRFVWAAGPALARNPQPPDVVFVGAQTGPRGIGAVNTAGAVTTIGPVGTNFQVPLYAGSFKTGTISLEPNRLNNLGVLGTPKDMEVGGFILSTTNPAQGTNNMTNPGRGSTNRPGVPDSQNGTTPSNLIALINPLIDPGPPQQPWGCYLYVVDGDAGAVKVFNSYNFQLLTTLQGIASPEGLGIAPNLEYLYISNFNQGTVTRVFANPASPTLHTVSSTITVGPGPQAVSVQGLNEDVFVANFAANSFSVIDASTSALRKTFTDSAAVGPSDIFVTTRMLGPGNTNAYQAFIVNYFSDNITVYESDSPAVPENTIDGVVKASIGGFEGPRRGTWNHMSYVANPIPWETGCFVANTLGTTVDEFTLQAFTLSPPPNFPGNPGTRDFHVRKSYNASTVQGIGNARPSDCALDNHSFLFNLNAVNPVFWNNKGVADQSLGGGTPGISLVSYPAAGIVVAFDFDSTAILGSTSVPGCDFLHTYYDQ